MIRIVLCNCSPGEASTLARRLVEENLAACVNLIKGVKSFYRWEGELCEDEEVTLLIKTTEECFSEMSEKLTRYHSYEVPEILALDSADVSKAYGEWVYDQLRQ